MKRSNKKRQTAERRSYPRIERTLPLTLEGGHFFLSTETRNISASGAYCRVTQPVRELTQLGVTLLIPVEAHRDRGNSPQIQCKGVVVRSEKILREGGVPETFFIAIYFTDLKKSDQEKLLRYIGRQLREETVSRGA